MTNRISTSLAYSGASAFAGWAAGVVAIVICSGVLVDGGILGLALLAVLLGVPVVLLVWLVLLWPLYALVPRTSVLWQPAVCVSCGMAAGGLLAAVVILLHGWGDGAPFLAAPLIGGVICAVGCKLNALEPDYIKPPSRPSFYRHAVQFAQRPARWFWHHFLEWSGQ